jgi:hypothetical protein
MKSDQSNIVVGKHIGAALVNTVGIIGGENSR